MMGPTVLVTALLYVAGFLAGLASLRDGRWRGPARTAAGAAWVVHTLSVAGAAFLAPGWSLWTTVPGAVLLVTWLAASSYFVGDELIRDAAPGRGEEAGADAAVGSRGLDLFVFPAVALGLGLDLVIRWAARSSQPGRASVLLEPWVPVHAFLAAAGWGLFTLAWVAGTMYRAQHRSLKGLAVGPLSRLLPSLEALDRASLRLAVAGLVFLTAGLVPGIIRAVALWGRLWFADPKVISTFLAALSYALYLVVRTGFGWTPRRASWLLTVGFILTAVNLLVASPFLSRFHQWL